MPKKLDLIGKNFGRLIVISESGRDGHGASLWECRCECGGTKRIRGAHLAKGCVKSCGCLLIERAIEYQTTHGQSKTPLYRRWRSMRGRCENPNDSEYRNYGGRGITVCSRWMLFEAFSEDMSPSFLPSLEIDRIDTNGNYEPDNCQWVTRRENQRNKRNNHVIEFQGHKLTLVEWEELTGIKANTILTRIRRGWPLDRVLMELANKD